MTTHLISFTFIALLLGVTIALSAEVMLTVDEPSGVERRGWPVTSGIPLARGTLLDAQQAALFTTKGRGVPLQTEALSRWQDGSVRWLLLDFQIDLKPGESKTFVLRYGQGTKRAAVRKPVQVSQDDRGVVIDTGPLRVRLSQKEFRLLDAVWLDADGNGKFSDEERITGPDGAGIVLKTPDGECFRADLSPATLSIEESGPLRVCVRVEGKHASPNGAMFRYVVSIHAFRGQPFLRVQYTFINDNQEELMTNVESLDLDFSLRDKSDLRYVLDGSMSSPGRLFQVDDRGYEVDGKPAGQRAAGWTAIGNSRGGLAVGVREFWQNWPKALEARTESLSVGICPEFPKGQYDGKPLREECELYYYLREGVYTFKIGAARTHELWVTFFPGKPKPEHLGEFFKAAEKPLLARCDPAYISATEALGNFPPADPAKYHGYDQWVKDFFDLHLADRERVREYGMLNYGDWYDTAWDSWGNLEYDLARICFVQYLRTGNRRYFDRAEQASRHFMDVDVINAVNPILQKIPASSNARPGQVWAHSVGHTGGYYEDAPLKMVGALQTGLWDYGHTWVEGVLDHYLLTGDCRAREVGVLVSDTMSDLCPTRYTDHIREIGWPLNLVVAAYEATGDTKYLDAATRQWQLLKQNLDPEKGWVILLAYGHCLHEDLKDRCHGNNSYMLGITLSGLARYHRLTGDPEVLRALSVGIDQLIRECWKEEAKSFSLAGCRSSPPIKYCSATFMMSEAFKYEIALTGNEEHRRIIREALHTAIEAGRDALPRREPEGQTGYYAGMFHFAPFGLGVLDKE